MLYEVITLFVAPTYFMILISFLLAKTLERVVLATITIQINASEKSKMDEISVPIDRKLTSRSAKSVITSYSIHYTKLYENAIKPEIAIASLAPIPCVGEIMFKLLDSSLKGSEPELIRNNFV